MWIIAKREFLQLAHPFNPAKHHIAGWFLSEKLDGLRAFWDGGISRGIPASQVPWANVEKDARLRTPPIATGLWSRYGKVIHAPDWWLDELPNFQLDGELWMGAGLFQSTVSVTKDHIPGPGWREIKYAVIDCPPLIRVFGDGEINNTNFRKRLKGCDSWVLPKQQSSPPLHIHLAFEGTYRYLKRTLVTSEYCFALEQEQLPFTTQAALNRINERLDEVLATGGEGVILRKHSSSWVPERTHNCLKLKPFNDMEGTVVGYVWGRETDKGSKLLGLMGALILKLDNGKRLELSGFTDAERGMRILVPGQHINIDKEPYYNAGKEVTGYWHNPTFPIGTRVSFKYRELTNDGIPKEARFWRKRTDLSKPFI